MLRLTRPLVPLFALAAVACSLELDPPQAGPGHEVRIAGEPRVLIGASATQAVLQNENFDMVAWLEDLDQKGIRAAMVWSFMAVPQTSDGQVLDERYGYVVPGMGPWTRDLPPPMANDGQPRWNLRSFDEARYWSRLRELVRETGERGMVLWITVFDGWAKERGEIPFHPFRSDNGGPLSRREDFVKLAGYEREITGPYRDDWGWREKNQWFQEQLADRLAQEVDGHPHVVLEIFNEGEWYDQRALIDHQRHFLRFFRKRVSNLLALNADHARLSAPWDNPDVDIVSWHTRGFDTQMVRRRWLEGFRRKPAKPVVNSETVPPFPGGYGEEVSEEQVRRLVWTTVVTGGHVFVQDDAAFEFDPHAPRVGGDVMRTQVGIASRFLEHIGYDPRAFAPAPDCSDLGFCVAREDREMIIYLPDGGSARPRLTVGVAYDGEWLDPRDGSRDGVSVGQVPDSGIQLAPPGGGDWVLYLRSRGGANPP